MTKPYSPQPRTVVVGAGFAGLGAAKTLFAAGLRDVILLESGSRVGGRACTQEVSIRIVPSLSLRNMLCFLCKFLVFDSRLMVTLITISLRETHRSLAVRCKPIAHKAKLIHVAWYIKNILTGVILWHRTPRILVDVDAV